MIHERVRIFRGGCGEKASSTKLPRSKLRWMKGAARQPLKYPFQRAQYRVKPSHTSLVGADRRCLLSGHYYRTQGPPTGNTTQQSPINY